MKDCSTFLAMKSMQLKTTLRLYHEDAGKKDSSYTVARNVNYCSHCGNQYVDSAKKKVELS